MPVLHLPSYFSTRPQCFWCVDQCAELRELSAFVDVPQMCICVRVCVCIIARFGYWELGPGPGLAGASSHSVIAVLLLRARPAHGPADDPAATAALARTRAPDAPDAFGRADVLDPQLAA